MAIERRAPVLDLSRPGGDVAIEVDVSEAAELLMSMCALAGSDWDTLDLGRERLETLAAGAPAALLREAEDLLAASQKLPAHLLGLVVETPRPRSVDAFLQVLEATSPVEMRLNLLDYYNTGHRMAEPSVMEAAAEGDAGARETLIAALGEWKDKCVAVERLLDVPAVEFKSRLLALVRGWHDEIFAPLAEEAMGLAERDAEAKRRLARSLAPEDFVERATNGLRYAPPPHIRTIVLFPSYWERPWVVLTEHKHARIFCYPISVDREESGGGDPAHLARVYKALGDEGRLRLLRRLEGGSMTLGEAADELGVAKSTAHHHLSILRQAGFVVVQDVDDREYALRRDLLPQAGELLGAFLRS